MGRSVSEARLHAIIGGLVLFTFILIIARLAIKGTPSSRANTWGIAVVRIFKKTYAVSTADLKPIVSEVGGFSCLSIDHGSCRKIQKMGEYESKYDIEYHRYGLLVCPFHYHNNGDNGSHQSG